jgi:hypothetical protein
MTALERLFNGEPPKKNAGSTPTNPQPKKHRIDAEPQSPKIKPALPSDDGKVTCSECGDSVWKFQQNNGVCKPCQKKSKGSATPKPKAQPKATPKKEAKAVKQPKTTKSENRKKGLKSDHWHNKPATFPQTSRLKKETGLKTWDLETPLTRLQASHMISEIEENGAEGVETVTGLLVEHFGCEPYVRPSQKVKSQATTTKPKGDKPIEKMTKAELLAYIQNAA